MKEHRPFDRFGFRHPYSAFSINGKTKQLNQYNEWFFDTNKCNWSDTETENTLIGYSLTPKLNSILINNIDTSLQ